VIGIFDSVNFEDDGLFDGVNCTSW
jgi:hypothetical protein